MPDFENYQPHPALLQEITLEQRAKATRWLVDAYNDNRLSPQDYERRYAAVLQAQNRAQMDDAFAGLITPTLETSKLEPVPPSALLPPRPDTATSAPRPATTAQAGTGAAVFAHASFFFLWLFGPLLTYAMTRKGSYAHREAAKAFNWQLFAFIVSAIVGAISNMFMGAMSMGMGHHMEHHGGGGPIPGLLIVIWFVLTLIGAIKAGHGEDWKNPVMRVVPLKPLKES